MTVDGVGGELPPAAAVPPPLEATTDLTRYIRPPAPDPDGGVDVPQASWAVIAAEPGEDGWVDVPAVQTARGGVGPELAVIAAGGWVAPADYIEEPPVQPDPAEPAKLELELDRTPAPPATVGEVLRGLTDAVGCAGEILSATVTGYTREAFIHTPDRETFRAWCAYLHIDRPENGYDRITGAQAWGVAAVHGWTLRVLLVYPAAEAAA